MNDETTITEHGGGTSVLPEGIDTAQFDRMVDDACDAHWRSNWRGSSEDTPGQYGEGPLRAHWRVPMRRAVLSVLAATDRPTDSPTTRDDAPEPVAAISDEAVAAAFHTLENESLDWWDGGGYPKRTHIRSALTAALPHFAQPAPGPVPVVTDEAVAVFLREFAYDGLSNGSYQHGRRAVSDILAVAIAASPSPPADAHGAAELDVFVAWVDKQRTDERYWVLQDRTDHAELFWRDVAMAEAVARFRASRADTGEAADGDDER